MLPEERLRGNPLVAILRGIEPPEAAETGRVLFDAGIRVIEVPLNSPSPFKSIERIARALGGECLCGAGTVLDAKDIASISDAGGTLVVAPNTDPDVIGESLRRGILPVPGFATATEAFAAIKAGARFLKLFPASVYGPAHIRALNAVLPADVKILAVGGIGADEVAAWRAAGAAGFGFGSEIFKPGYSQIEIATRAARVVEAFRRAAKG